MEDAPLAGIRVVDACGAIGAYCTKLLADFGADVVKIEPPEGDALRSRPPFKGGVPHPERSLAFAYYHQNKRGVTLDLTRSEAKAIYARLLHAADVVVIGPEPDYPDDDSRTAMRIACLITPYGSTGPYRTFPATHLTSCAMGGVMLGRSSEEAPVPIPDQQMYDDAATHAALAILVALRNRSAAGGQRIELSVHEVLAAKNHAIQRFALAGFDDLQTVGALAPPAGTYACADGEIEVQAGVPRHWEAFKELLGQPEELADPALNDRLVRQRRAERLRAVIEPLIARESKLDLFTRAQALGIPCAPVNTLRDFVQDVQTTGRGTFGSMQRHDHLGAYPAQRAFRCSAELAAARRPAPLLGEHNEEIYVRELGFSSSQVTTWRREGVV